MKLGFRDIAPFLRQPDPSVRVILIYGPEAGLVQERASQLLHHFADTKDPLALVQFQASNVASDPASFLDETNSVSLLGPARRIIKLVQAEDACTPALKDFLTSPNPDVTVLVLAGNLGPRSLLRLFAEKEKLAVALPCYVENAQELQSFIGDFIRENGCNIDRDALAFLANNLAGDRLLARRQLEKIIVYKGANDTQITMEDVRESIPDLAAQSLDDVVYAAFAANWPPLFRAMDSLLSENTSFMLILRSLQNHAKRLEQTHTLVSGGQAMDMAMKSLNPPVFFKLESAFKGHLNLWPAARLAQLQSDLMDLEVQLKTYPTDMTAPLMGQWLLQTMSARKAA